MARSFANLLIGLCDGELDPLQRERLVEILRGNAEARAVVHPPHDAARAAGSGNGYAHGRIGRPGPPAALPPQPTTTPVSSGKGRGEGQPRSPVLGFLGDIGGQGWGFVSDHTTLFSALAALIFVAVMTALAVRNGDLGRQNTAAKSEIADLKAEASRQAAGQEKSGSIKDQGKPEIGNREVASSPLPPSSLIPRPSTVARLVRASSAAGTASRPPRNSTGRWPPGNRCTWPPGWRRSTSTSGRKVILQGPASFELLSANSRQAGNGQGHGGNQDPSGPRLQDRHARGHFRRPGHRVRRRSVARRRQQGPRLQGPGRRGSQGPEGRAAPACLPPAGQLRRRLEQGERNHDRWWRTPASVSSARWTRPSATGTWWPTGGSRTGRWAPPAAKPAKNTRPVCATVDSSFNGNDLYA